MKTIFFIITLLFLSVFSWAQNTIKANADAMGKALLAQDYETYVQYAYPKIVKDLGGKEKMIATLKKQMSDFDAQGVKILSITYGEPSSIIKEKAELQATIPQQMIFVTKEGKIQSTSSLIAVSKDGGKHWYLIDPGGRDLETVRISLPNISKKLVLPPNAPVKMLK